MCQLHLSGFYFARSAALKPDASRKNTEHNKRAAHMSGPVCMAALYRFKVAGV
mgnify:CR=1 FL=1